MQTKPFILKCQDPNSEYTEYVLTHAESKKKAQNEYMLHNTIQDVNIQIVQTHPLFAGKVSNKFLFDNPINSALHLINGYWRDSGLKFYDRIICEQPEKLPTELDNSILYHGLTRKQIELYIKMGTKTNLDFVITKIF